ncbi:hypothetical protein ABEF92_006113 [Exophiala dermatitidis]|uniref:Mediator of RNA polymerase II transcription subunit 10 n=1 Tax=Exophiala dermatitidis (strain ATCC 34100 / CBS 525.76 / NIH/UT8656) TaxID=858893 RepID=H6BK58_EXODN|nr:AP2-associated kinase [Exophiala dermatitidis NIH/UT8656]EHY52492.1 AP2-associated kinase [Exophiala dermatitidis NIH/UT8656]
MAKPTSKTGRGGRGATRVSDTAKTNNTSSSTPPNTNQTQTTVAKRTRSGVRKAVQTSESVEATTSSTNLNVGTTTPETQLEEGINPPEKHNRPASTFVSLRVPSEGLRRSAASRGPFVTLKLAPSALRSVVEKSGSPSSANTPTSSQATDDYELVTGTAAAIGPSRELYQTDNHLGAGLVEGESTATTSDRATSPTTLDSRQTHSTLVAPHSQEVAASSQAMAPVKDTSSVHNTIKDIIQELTDIQIQTHGYVPETQDLLVDKMTELAESLSRLQNLTSTTASPNSYIHNVQIAPEIVDYVDDGRNPDIFTRDFVENVQRGNAVINGKQHAFAEFAKIYAKALKEGIPGVASQVDKVLANAGLELEPEEKANPGADADYSSINGVHKAEGI